MPLIYLLCISCEDYLSHCYVTATRNHECNVTSTTQNHYNISGPKYERCHITQVEDEPSCFHMKIYLLSATFTSSRETRDRITLKRHKVSLVASEREPDFTCPTPRGRSSQLPTAGNPLTTFASSSYIYIYIYMCVCVCESNYSPSSYG